VGGDSAYLVGPAHWRPPLVVAPLP
jgi:hypothetical protein